MKSIKKFTKSTVITIAFAALGSVGLISVANAQGGGYHHGGYATQQANLNLSPEKQAEAQKIFAEIRTLEQQVNIKQAELDAKIYAAADSTVIDNLAKEVINLNSKLYQAHTDLQKLYGSEGIYMNQGMHRNNSQGMHRGNFRYRSGHCM